MSQFIQGDTNVKEEEITNVESVDIPYLRELDLKTVGQGRGVFVETYGCQMNVSDTEIIKSIMLQSGFTESQSAEQVLTHLYISSSFV